MGPSRAQGPRSLPRLPPADVGFPPYQPHAPSSINTKRQCQSSPDGGRRTREDRAGNDHGKAARGEQSSGGRSSVICATTPRGKPRGHAASPAGRGATRAHALPRQTRAVPSCSFVPTPWDRSLLSRLDAPRRRPGHLLARLSQGHQQSLGTRRREDPPAW